MAVGVVGQQAHQLSHGPGKHGSQKATEGSVLTGRQHRAPAFFCECLRISIDYGQHSAPHDFVDFVQSIEHGTRSTHANHQTMTIDFG